MHKLRNDYMTSPRHIRSLEDRRVRAQSIVGVSPGRNEYDFYPTPSCATEALLGVEFFEGEIWECACGNGAISRILEYQGYKVKSSDLINRGYGQSPVDFLSPSLIRVTDNIVTNPPYALAEQFVRKALQVAQHKVAMLLKLSFLEGARRSAMFLSTPLARVHVFSRRLTMTRNGLPMSSGGMIAFAWFVWDHDYSGRPKLNWLLTPSARQSYTKVHAPSSSIGAARSGQSGESASNESDSAAYS